MQSPPNEARQIPWATTHAAGPSASADCICRELESLYNQHAESLLRFALGATADPEFARESVQEIFLRYAELLQRDSPPHTPFVWLLRELRAGIARRGRERERRATGRVSSYLPSADPSPSPEMLTLVNEARRLIDRIAAPRELECFLLRSEGLSYDEIAGIMGISIGTVGATLARAARKLERALEAPESTAP